MARISLFSRRLFIYSSSRYGDSRFHRRLSGYRVCLCSPHSTEDLLHSVSISGLGRIAHRQRQQFTDLVVPALHGAHLLSSLSASSAGHSAILSCAALKFVISKPPQSYLYFVRAHRYQPPKQRVFYYAVVLAEVLNIIRIRLLTQSKRYPLHFPKRRPGPGGTADRFQALLPEAQR